MAIDLTGKVCVITGAGEGVGRGLVLGFQRRGAHAIGGVRSLEKSAAAIAPSWAVKLDVTKADEVRAAVEAIVARHGRIDVWINNAGIYPRQAADTLTLADWRRILDTNLDGAWRCCEAIIPHLKRQQAGVILNVGSITLRLGMAQLTHYHASKGGLVGLTRGLARDLGQYNVRVNCVHLGAVQTEGELRLFPDQAAVLKSLEEKQALRGRLTPETVEPVFAFLASDESRDISGQCLTVDRGWAHD
ncbi:MAG: SDR family oxidoreductase [Verrucomicrobia bacterium]|nr:SDR family oxidoreductase [Verrucomicrobiota bacterium]